MPWQDLDDLTPSNLNARSGAVFSVIDPTYSADSSGANDSTVSIQAAISAATAVGGTVYFPAGTYKISTSGSSALIANGPVTLLAHEDAWLQFDSAQTSTAKMFVVNTAPSTDSVGDVRVIGVNFDGNNVARANGIRAHYTTRMRVDRCTFRNFAGAQLSQPAYAIYVAGQSTNSRTVDTTVTGCSFYSGTFADGVFLYWNDGAVVANNHMRAMDRAVYVFGQNRNVTIDNNDVVASNDNGIRVDPDSSIVGWTITDAERIAIMSNLVRGSRRDGIRTTMYQSTIQNNVCSENTLSGIRGLWTQDCVISGNVAVGNQNHGICLDKQSTLSYEPHQDVVIANNVTKYNGSRGIKVIGGSGASAITAARGVIVTNNVSSFNSFDGILMHDCQDCQVTQNIVHSNGSVSNIQGIDVKADVLSQTSTGRVMVFSNRVYDSRSSANAFQVRGINFWASSGLTLGPCRAYFNDVTLTASNNTTSAIGVRDTLGPGWPVGNFYLENIATGVAAASNLTASASEATLI